ncbi:MAG: RHS repeat-associated core domain-containing protein, partial [Chloroflexales bacterium]|nr:RHS repeat-associated core domain-containing protein [Chloroflexales bacterium]
ATYNGDGVLVQRGATAYTQDLAAPLSQVLNDGSANSVYGMDRLLTDDGSAQTWYLGDALGSVRMTLNDSGAVQGTVGYDPWGAPQGELLGAFGFTGEVQDDTSGLVHVRARWYDPRQSTFTSRDPFAGFPEMPYRLHPYQYGYSNPALWTDPTGECVGWIWGDPTCRFIGWDRVRRGDLNDTDATPWAGAGGDFTPFIGDMKGLIAFLTGCDLVTDEPLGWWRWAGLFGVSELRHLRQIDALVSVGQFADAAEAGIRVTDRLRGLKYAGRLVDLDNE